MGEYITVLKPVLLQKESMVTLQHKAGVALSGSSPTVKEGSGVAVRALLNSRATAPEIDAMFSFVVLN